MYKQKLWYLAGIVICAGLCGACDDDSGKKSNPSTEDCTQPGYVRCNDSCIDPMTNSNFCGADSVCGKYEDCTKQGKTCNNGVCVGGNPINDCEPGKVKCGEDCIAPSYTDKYCGADENCQNYIDCTAEGKICKEGACVSGTVNDCDPSTKPDGDCYCDGGSWNCGCDINKKPDIQGTCKCKEDKWFCDVEQGNVIFAPSESYSTIVNEGDYIYFDVSLDRPPAPNELVRVGFTDPTYNYAIGDSVEFTAENWSDPVKVLIQTERDYQHTGDREFNFLVLARSDTILDQPEPEYRVFINVNDIMYTIHVIDIDEACKLMYSPSEDIQTTEVQLSTEIYFWLTCQPSSEVRYV